jgi:hypothetical protein
VSDRGSAAPVTRDDAAPCLSFIIPVRNDAERLRRCLASIAANRYPAGRVEVIVADNGSTDLSAAVARAAGARVVPSAELSVAAVRNQAASVATGDILAFVDADHEIAPTWTKAAVASLAEDVDGAAGALCVPPPEGTWVQQMYGALRGRTRGRSEVTWLGAGNLAVRRTAFMQVGGFDATLESCEDVDLCHRLRAAGWRVVADGRLGNIHAGDPATLGGLFRAERWRGRDNLRVTFRAPVAARDLPSVVIPVVDAIAIGLAGAGVLLMPAVGQRVVPLVAFSLGIVVAASVLRAFRMITTARLDQPLAMMQALIVALTYDLARSAALVTRARHHRTSPLVKLARPGHSA